MYKSTYFNSKKQMEYRIIILKDGKLKKVLYKYKTRVNAFIRFNNLKNVNVLFPKEYSNKGVIKPVKYDICVVKETEPSDVFRTVRDSYGKVVVEKPLNGWTILASHEYYIEERFNVFGYGDDNTRVTIHDVVKILMINGYSKKQNKQVIVVHNKLLIHNEEMFYIVICKNIYDCQRLHHLLSKTCNKLRIKSVLFMGTANVATKNYLYKLIMEKTGWSYKKTIRTTTRP